MKKILCLLLSLVMLGGIAAINACAQRDDDEIRVEYYKFGESNGYDICIIDAIVHLTTWTEVIGDYVFFSPYTPGKLPEERLAIYAVKGDKKIYLKDANEQNLINIDEVAQMVNGFDQNHITYAVIQLGDVDANGKLEIKDVMEIQKVVAKVKWYENIGHLYDKNQDGEITVADAIEVQKMIAKIEA